MEVWSKDAKELVKLFQEPFGHLSKNYFVIVFWAENAAWHVHQNNFASGHESDSEHFCSS